MALADELARAFGDRARANVPLAPLTTFRVGGPADWLVEVRSGDDVAAAVRIARAAGVPLTVLGGGSNVLVSDAGVRGIVALMKQGSVRQAADDRVVADAAVTINGLVRWTIGRGLAGLEAWAGTPGTVGGAVYGNAHFQGRLVSEHVTRVRLVTREGTTREVPASEMAFGYDRSRLQSTGEILLDAEFRVGRGDPATLREIARASLAYRKRTQPLHMPSAGCVFQNPSAGAALPDGVPCSAGALIDLAGLKGASVGAARVSPVHANFIVNEGGASASDVRALIERCRGAVRDTFGLRLEEEIVYMGEW
jgi:UDP-N-acetylmuramate dehydrogenase